MVLCELSIKGNDDMGQQISGLRRLGMNDK